MVVAVAEAIVDEETIKGTMAKVQTVTRIGEKEIEGGDNHPHHPHRRRMEIRTQTTNVTPTRAANPIIRTSLLLSSTQAI